MSQDPDEGLAPCPQDAKRPHKASTGKGPIHQRPAKNTPRVKRYGCLGGANTCQEHKNRQWTSALKFREHIQDNHSEEYKSVDRLSDGTHSFICPDCESNRFLLTGTKVWKWRSLRDLATHIYNVHLVRTKSKLHHTNEVEAKDQPEEPADIPHAKSSSTELEHQLQIIATPDMAEVKPGEPSDTRYEYINFAETDNFSHPDIGTDPVV